MVETLTDDEAARLFPILATRARATESSSPVFRPPRTGIVEQVASDWHHFVVGRRGVGKSMLLLNVAQHAAEKGQPAAYIDIETLRDNPFPDVLIRLLIELTTKLDEHLSGVRGRVWKRWVARKRLRSLRNRLRVLLADPQQSKHSVAEARTTQSNRVTKASGRFGVKRRVATGAVETTAEEGASGTTATNREATFVRTKIEGLRAESIEFREVLREALDATGGSGALFILDDFYFIRREDQPGVLSYLQQVVKNLGIWLKVGAVEHRLNEFEDGDPPRGLQLTQDAGKVPMDVTLADFDHTKTFLESILGDVCEAADVKMDSLVTDTARLRLVLASGGVPRDYVNLVSAALDKATRRKGEPNKPRNRITAEDVNVAAPDFLKQKEDDLRVDARAEDVGRLRDQLYDVLSFCLVHRRTNVFTVEARLLREEQWGRDIAALSDLRFFHRFSNFTVKSSDPGYVGQRYEAFALDLSAYAATRVRTSEVEFWTTDGLQRCRGVSYVYTPAISRALSAEAIKQKTPSESEPRVSLVMGQISIYDALEETGN